MLSRGMLVASGAVALAVAVGGCGGTRSGTSTSDISTCAQYQSASANSKMAFVKSIDAEVAINQNDASYWVTGITDICSVDGTPQSSINQLLVDLGYLGPGQ